MTFWTPDHTPPAGSWPAPDGPPKEGTVTRLGVELSRYGRPSLCVELDGDGVKRWCGMRLWRGFAELRVEVGERVRVTRLTDEPATAPGQRPGSRWLVERLPTATPPTVTAGTWAPATTAPDRPQW